MGVFKIEKCPTCLYNRRESNPGENGACPKCGQTMRFSDNWHISYSIMGRKKVESVSPKKSVARDALAKVRVQIREGRFFDKVPSTPWREAVRQFRGWFQVNTAPATARMYENSLKALEPHFSRYSLDRITPQMVEHFKALRAAETKAVPDGDGVREVPITSATVNRDLATIKRIFSLSEQWGLVETNRIRRVKLLRENNDRIRFLTQDEIGALLSECNTPQLRLAVQIALNTGLRKAGVMSLRWTEIDFPRKLITKTVKGEKRVHIPLSSELERELHRYRASEKILSQYVLPAKVGGGHLFDLKKGFQGALRRAKIEDFRFHDLRHTFASWFLMRTGDLKALQEILAHSDIKTTMRYAHLLDEHKHRAMEKFSNHRSEIRGDCSLENCGLKPFEDGWCMKHKPSHITVERKEAL